VPVVAGPGTACLRDGNAAEQQLSAAPEAHPLVLARLGWLTTPPYLVEVSGSGQNRGADVCDRNSRRPGDFRIRGVRTVEGSDAQYIAPLCRLVLGQ